VGRIRGILCRYNLQFRADPRRQFVIANPKQLIYDLNPLRHALADYQGARDRCFEGQRIEAPVNARILCPIGYRSSPKRA
jgi:hypothetical protein